MIVKLAAPDAAAREESQLRPSPSFSRDRENDVDPRSRFPRTPALSANEIHVVVVDLAEVELATASILDADERRRAARFLRPDDRDRYIASHVAFREVVGAVLHEPPVDVRWSMGRNDKPSVAGSTLAVSLSHSGARAAVALAWGRDVGVDIEQVRELDELEPAAVAFSPAEQRELLSYHDGRRVAFYRILGPQGSASEGPR